MVHLPWRYQSHARTMAAALRYRRGAIERVAIRFYHSGPLSWSPSSRWYFEANPGLSLADLGPHGLDLLAFFGLGRPLGALARLSGAPEEHELHVEIRLSGGLLAEVDVGWTAPLPSFTVCASGRAGAVAASLAGPHKGVWASPQPLDAAQATPALLTPRERARAEWRSLKPLPHLRDGGPLQDFLRSICSGTRPPTDVTHIDPWVTLLAGLLQQEKA